MEPKLEPRLQVIKVSQERLHTIFEFLSKPEIDQSFRPPLSGRSVSIEKRVFARNSVWLAALIENEVVGCWSVKDSRGTGNTFSTLVVDPSYRRRGIGRMLFERSIKEALGRGNSKLRFDSDDGNLAIVKLAEEHGFLLERVYYDSKRPQGVLTSVYSK